MVQVGQKAPEFALEGELRGLLTYLDHVAPVVSGGRVTLRPPSLVRAGVSRDRAPRLRRARGGAHDTRREKTTNRRSVLVRRRRRVRGGELLLHLVAAALGAHRLRVALVHVARDLEVGAAVLAGELVDSHALSS